ncbi:pectin methylesterase [Sphaerochaeta pleomorpha str. Grapes]|uniref:Pectin methylesterase n=1 Tax=Sphaerochaeta pleomorpha (strain ATCC BAA-1885 / DSM 22778 / Grapes) TaxID=158190 RepID=G8QY85_SPHPG|nr:pectinesterase family protein [Sphaerochaeta pleomorpha]AEV29650.1 pectin methylesterase [Sphaerochaeta pleomorpha str. Grapes]
MEAQLITIGPDGEFRTIQEGLDAKKGELSPLVFFLQPGVYREKLYIDHPDVTIRGDSEDTTSIVYGDSASSLCGGVPMGTFASATVTVSAPGFRAEHITIANDFDYPMHRKESDRDFGKITGLQAVALRTTGFSDCVYLSHCRFLGYQDTLFLDHGSHQIDSCTIEGLVDFIFGSGSCLFLHCLVVSRGKGYICAPSTKSGDLGFLFYCCRFVCADTGVPLSSVYLGRPWHPKADPSLVPCAVLVDCFLDGHICFEGWTSMHANCADGSQIEFTPSQSKFFESHSYGPGSVASPIPPRVSIAKEQLPSVLGLQSPYWISLCKRLKVF